MSVRSVFTIYNCARCGGNHVDLLFQPLTHPVDEEEAKFTHWAPCPTNGEPILMTYTEDDSMYQGNTAEEWANKLFAKQDEQCDGFRTIMGIIGHVGVDPHQPEAAGLIFTKLRHLVKMAREVSSQVLEPQKSGVVYELAVTSAKQLLGSYPGKG